MGYFCPEPQKLYIGRFPALRDGLPQTPIHFCQPATKVGNPADWVARCPVSYTDFQLWKNNQFLKYLKTLGFKYDPFIFINCVVAWFNYWRHIVDDVAFTDTFEHPLIYWDTSQHRLLFVFLDFIVILWLFSLLSFIKKIF